MSLKPHEAQHMTPEASAKDTSWVPDLAALTHALQAAWAAIGERDRHVLGRTVVVVGPRGRRRIFGYHAASCWRAGTEDADEVFIAAEGLERPAVEVFETLLHEAAHSSARTQGISDTSRDGYYHNHRFAAEAARIGCQVSFRPGIGFSTGPVPIPWAVEFYGREIAGIAEALSLYRKSNDRKEDPSSGTRPGTQPRDRNLKRGACSCCGAILRASARTLSLGVFHGDGGEFR